MDMVTKEQLNPHRRLHTQQTRAEVRAEKKSVAEIATDHIVMD